MTNQERRAFVRGFAAALAVARELGEGDLVRRIAIEGHLAYEDFEAAGTDAPDLALLRESGVIPISEARR